MRTVTVRDVPITLDADTDSTQWWCDQLDADDWEPDTFDAIDEYAPERFLDVGAWCGIFSIYAAVKYGSACHAFEPDPVSFGMLCRNVEMNPSSGIIEAWNAALWTHDGEVEMHVQGELGDSMTGMSRKGAAITVKCVSVDTLAKVFPNPSLAKIDIEGGEGAIWAPFRERFDCPVHLSWHNDEARLLGSEPPGYGTVGGSPEYPTYLVR